MAINPYISSANVFVYPCANRKEGFWESKLATEYSLRTLIPWKITKPSFVITGDAAASNLEFVINGYYFNIKRTAINPTSGQPLWAHIRLANKPLTSTAEGETTTILVNYEDGSQILDEGTFPNCTFKGVRFDSSAGTEATNYYHLQILDEDGNFLHRDMIKINCDDPLEQDDETGLLSLKYRSPLKVDNEELTLDYDSTLTLSSNKLSVTNPANTYIQPVTSGTHTSAGTLTYLKVGTNYYTIPQGKTYTASNQGITLDNTTFKLLTSDGLAIGVGDTGTNKYLRIALADSSGLNFDDSLPGKLSIKLADNSGLDKNNGLKINLNGTCGLTVDANNFLALKLASNSGLNKDSGLSLNLANNSGLDKSNGLKIKVNATSGLELTSDGLKMKYPLPSITDNDTKILAVNSEGNGLEWVEKPSGGGGTYSEGNGISINSNNAISVNLATDSGLEFSSKKLRLKKSNGINIDSNGVFIKLSTPTEDTTNKGGLWADTNGLGVNRYGKYCGITTAGSASSYALYLGTEPTTLSFTANGENSSSAYINAVAYPYGSLILLYLTDVVLPGSTTWTSAKCTATGLFIPTVTSLKYSMAGPFISGSTDTVGFIAISKNENRLQLEFENVALSMASASYYKSCPLIFPCTYSSLKV